MAAGKLTRCQEQLLLLKLQEPMPWASSVTMSSLSGTGPQLQSAWPGDMRYGHPRQAAAVVEIRYLLQQRLIPLECQHKDARERFSIVCLL